MYFDNATILYIDIRLRIGYSNNKKIHIMTNIVYFYLAVDIFCLSTTIISYKNLKEIPPSDNELRKSRKKLFFLTRLLGILCLLFLIGIIKTA